MTRRGCRCRQLEVWLGEPFQVRHGESVQLADGVKLKFTGLTSEGRCPVDVTCVWQGEAIVDIELQVKGQTARGAISTVKPDSTLLAHGVKLLGLYPSPRESEKRPANEYVAFFLVTDTAPAPAMAFANRAAAQAAAGRYLGSYTRSTKQVCADWERRQLASYIEDSAGLCQMIGKVSPTAHAVSEDDGNWRFFFMIDDPQMRTQMSFRQGVPERIGVQFGKRRFAHKARVAVPFSTCLARPLYLPTSSMLAQCAIARHPLSGWRALSTVMAVSILRRVGSSGLS